MVNIAGRSRGCATCRKRKVKCDESVPECLRCLNMGLRCPGARAGAFFVHHAVTKPRTSPTTTASCPNPTMTTTTTTTLLPLPGPQPPRATAFDQLFVSHFIESFFGHAKPPPMPGAPPKIWLHELPVLLAAPDQPLAQHAIRATCMLSYGSLANDASIKMEARNWYAKALQGLQRLLSSGGVSFSEGAVCAAVMLVHFETWADTSHKAWLQHVKGAVMLLEAGGPGRCRSGFMHQLFIHLRLQAFIAATAENVVSVFASEEWMVVPFETYPKLIFDKLVDLLFTVQKCLALADEIIRATGDSVCRLMETLDTLVHDAVSEIRRWWIECTSTMGFGQTPEPTRLHDPSESLPGNPTPSLLPHSSIPMAALSSLFDAANIMGFRLLHLVSPSAVEHDHRVRQHCQSILSANQFINAMSGPAPDRGSTMMAFQLKIVSLWSSSSQQREAAVTMLHGDKVQGGGLADISAISWEYFADVAAHILKHHSSE